MIKFGATVESNKDTVVTCSTTDMDELMNFLAHYEKEYQYVIDDETGELLYRTNHPTAEDYMDEHFLLMCIGWVCRDSIQAPDPRDEIMDAIREVCEEFGGILTVPHS